MSACTFFGHRDCPVSIESKLRDVLIDLIENHETDTFYVGRQGAFDAIVYSVLHELSMSRPHIRCAIVLERMPTVHDFSNGHGSDTLLPEGIETVHPRFAISWRNKWMLKHADYVVTYVTRSWGGAAKFAEMAVRQKKTVINIASFQP